MSGEQNSGQYRNIKIGNKQSVQQNSNTREQT